MAAVAQDFEMFRGDDYELNVAVVDAAGAAKELTGATIKWQMSKIGATGKFSAAPALSKQTGGSGITITNAAGGLFTVTLAQSDTIGLVGTFYHEAEIVDNAGTKVTVMTGTGTIKPALIA